MAEKLYRLFAGIQAPAWFLVLYLWVDRWSNTEFFWGKARDMVDFLDAHPWLVPAILFLWAVLILIGVQDRLVVWFKENFPPPKSATVFAIQMALSPDKIFALLDRLDAAEEAIRKVVETDGAHPEIPPEGSGRCYTCEALAKQGGQP